MTITFQGSTIADDSASRSGVAGLRASAAGNVQVSPGVDGSEPLVEGRGNNSREVTFTSRMQHATPAAALEHWDGMLGLPGQDGALVIGGHSHHAACRRADGEPQGVRTIITYTFVIGQEPS